MPARPIVITGEPVLHRRALPVEDFDDTLQSLIEDMWITQDLANVVGLAAPQVGVGLRVWIDDLYGACKQWCEAEGRIKVSTKQIFGRDLIAAVPGIKPRVGTDNRRVWCGLALKR